MPKRTDIHSILIIGSGPIVIGQGCEFDYSGVQACRALKEEGYRVVLINSNPATIMTDPEFADATYIEPITPEAVEKILEREIAGRSRSTRFCRPSAGRRGLIPPMACYDKGIFTQFGVQMIGANREAIFRGEDRQVFKDLMIKIGLKVPLQRRGAYVWTRAERSWTSIGLPLIIRPAFTLGGTGGGIAYNVEEFDAIVQRGLDASPVTEVLIEQSVIGWKEYELEVMRDTQRQRRHHLLDRKHGPHGRPHRRQHHGRADPDAHRQGIPADARCGHRDHPGRRRGNRRKQHPIRRQSRQRRDDRRGNEPARVALVGPGLQGDGLSHRQDWPPNWRWATRWMNCPTTSPARRRRMGVGYYTALFRADDRLLRDQDSALDVREIPRCR